jgi:hypothetical protein
MLGRRDGEQRVGQRTAARRPARRLGHAGRVRVDPDDERVGPRRRRGEHGTAVAGPEVDGDARMARRELGDLADVDFEEAAAYDDSEHGRKATYTSSSVTASCLTSRNSV